MTDKFCVLVTGIPRSGTSLVAGILHHLGIYMGEKFVAPHPEINPTGFFEDHEFTSIHQEVYTANNTNFFRNLLVTHPINRPDRYHKLIQSRINEYQKWGLKEHRIYSFINTFLEVEQEIKVINVTRRPDSVMNSLMNHPDFSDINHLEAMRIYSDWYQLNEYALSQLNGRERLNIWYERLITNPIEAVKKIANFVLVPLKQEAIKFINQKLNRNGEITDEILAYMPPVVHFSR